MNLLRGPQDFPPKLRCFPSWPISSPESYIFQGDLLENQRISKAFHGIKDLDAGQKSTGVLISGNPFRQMFCCYRSLFKAAVKGIHLPIISYFHFNPHLGTAKSSKSQRLCLPRGILEKRHAKQYSTGVHPACPARPVKFQSTI